MTDKRAEVIAEVFTENYERAKNMDAFKSKVLAIVSVIAAVFTIDDLLRSDPEDPGASLERKFRKLEKLME